VFYIIAIFIKVDMRIAIGNSVTVFRIYWCQFSRLYADFFQPYVYIQQCS